MEDETLKRQATQSRPRNSDSREKGQIASFQLVKHSLTAIATAFKTDVGDFGMRVAIAS